MSDGIFQYSLNLNSSINKCQLQPEKNQFITLFRLILWMPYNVNSSPLREMKFKSQLFPKESIYGIR